jgi:hypothetical protein
MGKAKRDAGFGLLVEPTAGEWTPIYGNGLLSVTVQAGDKLICEVAHYPTVADAEAEANARLIGKAPAMRKTLKEVEALLDGPIADLLTGDSMNDTGAYDVLANVKAALAGVVIQP